MGSAMHTENVARGRTGSFQNVRGGQSIQCINFSKVKGARAHVGWGKCLPPPPLNETLQLYKLELFGF